MPSERARRPSDKPNKPAKPSSGRLRAWVWLYLVAVLLVAAAMQWLGDRWWPATLILFAPRWPWALPLLLLVPLALFKARRLLWPLAGAGGVLLFGVAGLVPPSIVALSDGVEPAELRVLTYNLGGVPDARLITPWLERAAPRVAVFQECSALLEKARPTLIERGWKVELQQGSCLVSRDPIRRVEARDPKAIWQMHGSGVVVRYEIDLPGRTLNVVNLHLATVRSGLGAIMHRRLGGISELESNIEQRDLESMLARAFARESSDPLLVMGDFNMPVESTIYRRHWDDLENAFACAGAGFGHTKATRWHGVRIDHVLLGQGWRCLRTEVGEDLGGDHRPVIADLRWTGG